MKIATHNVEFLFGEGTYSPAGKERVYTPEFVEARVNHFSKLFSEMDADVFLLQEVASEDVIKRIIVKTGIDYSYFLATPTADGVRNAVLYKQKDVVCESIPAKTSLPVFVQGDVDTLGERIWSRRDFISIQTRYNNKPLYILGIHIKSNYLVSQKDLEGNEIPVITQTDVADATIRSEMFRFSQAKQVREIADRLFAEDPGAQILVAGDFNTREGNPVLRIIQGDIKKPGFLVSATKDVPEPKRYTVKSKDKTGQIDYVLISNGLDQNLSSANILNENLPDGANTMDKFTRVESDHAPVMVEFK